MGRPKKEVVIKKPINSKKRWKDEDNEFLTERFGNQNINYLASRLGRTPLATWRHATATLRLGGSVSNSEYIQLAEIIRQLNIPRPTINRWIENNGFPVIKITLTWKQRMVMVKVEELWKWLEVNPGKWNAYRLEALALGAEPEWVAEKRKHDFARLSERKPWKQQDREEAYRMWLRGIASEEIGKHFNRSKKAAETAVYRQSLEYKNGYKSL